MIPGMHQMGIIKIIVNKINNQLLLINNSLNKTCMLSVKCMISPRSEVHKMDMQLYDYKFKIIIIITII